MRKALIIILLFVLISTTAQASITIQNPTIDVNLIGGTITTEEITFSYTGGNNCPLSIQTEILPDDEGITVTYSNVPSTVTSGSTYTVYMHITSSLHLEPGSYTITTTFIVDQESEETEEPRHYTIIHYPQQQSQPIPYLPFVDTTRRPNPPSYIPPEDEPSILFPLLGSLAAAVLFGLLIFLRRRKQKR